MTLKEWLDRENLTVYRFAKNINESTQRIYKTINGSVPYGEYRKKLFDVTRGEVAFLGEYNPRD